eukprot:CFRG4184T1
MSVPAKKLFVFFGPSGAGKSTMLKQLFLDFPSKFGFSTSHTTRNPRPGEQHGVDYNYISREEMHKAIAENTFIEHAEFSGNLYGTSYDSVKKVIESGRICVLDIEVQGVQNIKKTSYNAEALYVYVKPPSVEILELRLRKRKTDTEQAIQKRLITAQKELIYGDGLPESDDIIKIVNDEFERAYAQLKAAVMPYVQ